MCAREKINDYHTPIARKSHLHVRIATLQYVRRASGLVLDASPDTVLASHLAAVYQTLALVHLEVDPGPSSAALSISMMITLIQAIARQEGFYKNGTRAQRNNNPGNINFSNFALAHSALGPDDKRYAIFPTPEVGFAALEALLKTERYRGKTLERALYMYCPPTGDERGLNDIKSYILNVCTWTGLTPDTVIDPYVSARIRSI